MAHKQLWMRVGGVCGVLLVVIYTLATVVGSILRPSYSNIRDSVSELTEIGAPNKAILDLMFGTHHLMLILFAIGLYLSLPRANKRWLGPSLFGLAGFVGLLITLFFPCDVGCEANPTTVWGKGHGILVAVSAMLVFVGMLTLAGVKRKNTESVVFARYTFISALLILVMALASVPLLNTQYTGLAERIALAPLFIWFVLSGYRVWRTSYLR